MLDAVRNGATTEQASNSFGCSQRHARDLCRKHGVTAVPDTYEQPGYVTPSQRFTIAKSREGM